MKLTKVSIKNYRLLNDVTVDVDSDLTVIVGRNNSGKTSFFTCLRDVITGRSFSFNDYPLCERKKLLNSIHNYVTNSEQFTFTDLKESIKPISVNFIVDYSEESEEDCLGVLSPFIIDLDDSVVTAEINVEYRLKPDENSIRRLLEITENAVTYDESALNNVIQNKFPRLFEYVIYAVNPIKRDEKQIVSQRELSELFPVFYVKAERDLGEDESGRSSLSRVISNYLDKGMGEISSDLEKDVLKFRKAVADYNNTIQVSADSILNRLLDKTVGFGYPNTEDLQLKVTTQLDIGEQLKNQTELSYTTLDSSEDSEKLPSNYNGLGYKNLIKMVFLLSTYMQDAKNYTSACIPLLFVEEPESHMHPQMQDNFVKYINKFLEDHFSSDSEVSSLQVFISTHSSHIANTVPFSKIRYARKKQNGIEYKNLCNFSDEGKDNLDFLRKYLTLTKCDLFFADKIILVEGASERILLPDMIDRCDDGSSSSLKNQYYTIIEIGGAYAHKFIPFIEFLDIPCLIITDLDPIDENNKATLVSQGYSTSNATIKFWLRRVNPSIEDRDISLEDVLRMPSSQKTIGKWHIEFQTEEHGLCGHSLEEAIINVNRDKYMRPDKNQTNRKDVVANVSEGNITEADIEFKGKSKTEFALNLIYGGEEYCIPSYIQSGIKWLEKQSTDLGEISNVGGATNDEE